MVLSTTSYMLEAVYEPTAVPMMTYLLTSGYLPTPSQTPCPYPLPDVPMKSSLSSNALIPNTALAYSSLSSGAADGPGARGPCPGWLEGEKRRPPTRSSSIFFIMACTNKGTANDSEVRHLASHVDVSRDMEWRTGG